MAAAIDASHCVSVADPGQPLAPAALPVVLPDPAYPLLVGEHGKERAPSEHPPSTVANWCSFTLCHEAAVPTRGVEPRGDSIE